MRVDRIELDGFRNYEGFAADFHPGVNVIWGENAQGKTNLLEAIGYLSGARSHRTRGDRDLISFHLDRGTLTARAESREMNSSLLPCGMNWADDTASIKTCKFVPPPDTKTTIFFISRKQLLRRPR